jgi:AraC-like DNA-binding protein/tetratricopeptide (TPR) repeat protein
MNYYSTILLILLCIKAAAQSQEIDSIKNLLTRSKDTVRVNLLNELSYKLVFSQPQEAEKTVRESIRLADQINFKRGHVRAYQVLGISFDLRSYYPDAIDAYNSALTLLKQLDTIQFAHRQLYAGLLNGLGTVCYRQSKYQEALAYYLHGTSIAETFPTRSQVAVLSVNIGLVYHDQREFDNAIAYYKRGLKFGQESGNKSVVGRAANNIGIIYKEKEEYTEAIHYYDLSLKIKKELNDLSGIGATLSNLGVIYKRLGNYDKALEYLQEASEIGLQTGDKLNRTNINDTKAEIYILTKQYRLAKELIDANYKLVKEIDTREPLLLVYERYMDFYKAQRQFEKAMEWQNKRVQLSDSLFNEKKSKQLAELQTRYETQKKEKTIQILERDKKIQILWKNISLAGLALAIIASTTVLLLLRYRERKNRQLFNIRMDYLIAENKELSDKYKKAVTTFRGESFMHQDQQLLKKALQLVEANITDPLFGVEKMAEEIGMSRASLHRKIKSITGFPPSEFIRSIRLKRAASLLLNKADSVSQIGYAVGFEDQSYFSKAFKREYGVSPSEYIASVELAM